MIVNVHRRKTPNQGDLASAPLKYIESSVSSDEECFVDILDCDGTNERVGEILSRSDLIVFGGGGLLDNKKFIPSFDYIKSKYSDKLVVWGAGSNAVATSSDMTDLNGIDLVGVRDYSSAIRSRSRWVPCASCLFGPLREYKSLASKVNPKWVGIFENNSGANVARVGDCGVTNFELMGNKKVSFKEVLEFIIYSEYLVTSSFHAAYWATLLGTPVLAVPTSSKFYTFKHKVPLVEKDNWLERLDEAVVHEGAFEECVEANLSFLSDVKDRFPLSSSYSLK